MEQDRYRLAIYFCFDRSFEELEKTSVLLAVGRNRRPHALVISLPLQAAGALSDFAIDDAMAHSRSPYFTAPSKNIESSKEV